MRLYWESISERDRNGIIQGYSIIYETICGSLPWHSGQVNITAPRNNYTLNALHPGVGYQLGIAAYTSKGMGPQSYGKQVWTST